MDLYELTDPSTNAVDDLSLISWQENTRHLLLHQVLAYAVFAERLDEQQFKQYKYFLERMLNDVDERSPIPMSVRSRETLLRLCDNGVRRQVESKTVSHGRRTSALDGTRSEAGDPNQSSHAAL